MTGLPNLKKRTNFLHSLRVNLGEHLQQAWFDERESKWIVIVKEDTPFYKKNWLLNAMNNQWSVEKTDFKPQEIKK